MASESIYAPKNIAEPVIDNDSKSKPVEAGLTSPHPFISRPILYISNVDATLTDRDMANGIFNPFVPVRLSINRGSPPLEGKSVSGTVEFQTIEKAEQAYATISDPRLSFNQEPDLDEKPSAKPRLVKQLPPDIEDIEIFDIFRAYGPIASSQKIMTNLQGQYTGFRGMAVVVFYQEKDAQKAQADLHCAEIEGNTISVVIDTAVKRTIQMMPRFSASAVPFVPGLPSSSSSQQMNATAPSFQPFNPDYSSTSSPPMLSINRMSRRSNSAQGGKDIDPCNLYCKNLDSTVDSAYLNAMFRPFGEIISARVMRDERGVSKGFGFVSFRKADDATRAMQEMEGTVHGSKQMVVRLHEPKRIRQEKLSQKYGSAYTESSGVEPLDTPSEGISSSLDGEIPQVSGYFSSTRVMSNGALEDLERLQSMSSTYRKEEVKMRLSEKIKELPDTKIEGVEELVSELCKLTLPDAVNALHEPQLLVERVREVQSRGQLNVESSISEIATASTPPKASERHRLEQAVISLLPLDEPAEDIVNLLMQLPNKERAMSLFNQEYLRGKIDAAKSILEMGDGDDAGTSLASPTPLTRENIALVTASPKKKFDSLPVDANAEYTLAELAALPALQVVELANSSPRPPLPLPIANPATIKATDEFLNSIQDLSLTDQKQKLGDQLFKKVKSFGVKGAPKITIALLDSEDLRALAHLMNSYPECLRQKVLLRAGK